jgi:hypothetical protein
MRILYDCNIGLEMFLICMGTHIKYFAHYENFNGTPPQIKIVT